MRSGAARRGGGGVREREAVGRGDVYKAGMLPHNRESPAADNVATACAGGGEVGRRREGRRGRRG